jgi:hypothetical protein
LSATDSKESKIFFEEEDEVPQKSVEKNLEVQDIGEEIYLLLKNAAQQILDINDLLGF